MTQKTFASTWRLPRLATAWRSDSEYAGLGAPCHTAWIFYKSVVIKISKKCIAFNPAKEPDHEFTVKAIWQLQLPSSLTHHSAAGANLPQPRSAEIPGSGGRAADRQSRACLSAASLRGGPGIEHCRWSPEGPAAVERKTRCGGSGWRVVALTILPSRLVRRSA